MEKTIQQLSQERGKSETQPAEAPGVTVQDIQDLERGIASPSVEPLPNGQVRVPGGLRS